MKITPQKRRKIAKALIQIGDFLVKCGGVGSGVPGPCPLPVSAKPPKSPTSQKLKSGEVLHSATQDKTGVWRTADGKAAPDHIQKLGLPPQWTKTGEQNPNALKNVRINLDPKGDCLATGKDSKGREKREYSDNHTMRAAADKFGRVSELRKKREAIFQEVDQDISKGGKQAEEALVTKLIMKTGMRPGSTKDTKAEHKSYGATTLEGRHIVQKSDGSVVVKFVPGKKKGQEIEMPILDKALGEQLLARSKQVGPEAKMFGTTAEKVRDYSKSKDGGGFKTKDHRTALGTETAIAAIHQFPEPSTVKEYKAAVKAVSTRVSDVLGNTPAIAFKSYIDPNVFIGWKSKVGA